MIDIKGSTDSVPGESLYQRKGVASHIIHLVWLYRSPIQGGGALRKGGRSQHRDGHVQYIGVSHVVGGAFSVKQLYMSKQVNGNNPVLVLK
jgi:hypothetical protein